MFAQGYRKKKSSCLWPSAKNDYRWTGANPSSVVLFYAPERGGKNAEKFYAVFWGGVLEAEGYSRMQPISQTGVELV